MKQALLGPRRISWVKCPKGRVWEQEAKAEGTMGIGGIGFVERAPPGRWGPVL